MSTRDVAGWQAEINEVKHRIELIVNRDGWEGMMTGDVLDGALAAMFNGVLTQGYQEAAEIATLRQADYPMHPIVRQALALLASHLRTL